MKMEALFSLSREYCNFDNANSWTHEKNYSTIK
jgi:hypothetical protein